MKHRQVLYFKLWLVVFYEQFVDLTVGGLGIVGHLTQFQILSYCVPRYVATFVASICVNWSFYNSGVFLAFIGEGVIQNTLRLGFY